MSKPIIVISAGKHSLASPAGATAATIVGCNIDYPRAVSLAGGAPFIIPVLADTEAVRAIIQVADGVLLTGGGDIHAEIYGEELHQTSARHDPDRDNMEIEVVRLAREEGLPILGICRGQQLLNIAFGGTLMQDIPSQHPDALVHSMPEEDYAMHEIFIEEDTLLARVMHAPAMMVNSWHHQAVKTVGPGLRIAARAADGVVEGIESAEGKPILAVQCHPEACPTDHPCYLTLFHWLVEEAEKFGGVPKVVEIPGSLPGSRLSKPACRTLRVNQQNHLKRRTRCNERVSQIGEVGNTFAGTIGGAACRSGIRASAGPVGADGSAGDAAIRAGGGDRGGVGPLVL
jgi:putative glutamine amidotransferase